MITNQGWKRGDEIEQSTVCVDLFYGTPVMFYLSIVRGIIPIFFFHISCFSPNLKTHLLI